MIIQTQFFEFWLFYQTENVNDIYHVTCKRILQDDLQDDYDYEFFLQSSSDSTFHDACKLISLFLIVDILNKEIYGMDFDVNDLEYWYLLTLNQKLNLEQNLKRILPLHLSQHSVPGGNTGQDSNENHPPTQVLKPNELRLFYHNDNNI